MEIAERVDELSWFTSQYFCENDCDVMKFTPIEDFYNCKAKALLLVLLFTV